mmetsp:Transcript_18224/g.25086  ORF Transcript_18224/g.25086 Transcript_18224/m.25086 type:complete len:144 (-) Transcript_18224:139-570(-)
MRNEYCPICRSQYLLTNDMSEHASSSQRSGFCNKVLMFVRSAQTHPEPQTRREGETEALRSRYWFCVDHGLSPPEVGYSMTIIQQTRNTPSSKLNDVPPKDVLTSDGSVEQNHCIEINEAEVAYRAFSGKNKRDSSDMDVIPL